MYVFGSTVTAWSVGGDEARLPSPPPDWSEAAEAAASAPPVDGPKTAPGGSPGAPLAALPEQAARATTMAAAPRETATRRRLVDRVIFRSSPARFRRIGSGG